MKKTALIVLMIPLLFFFFGCNKDKKESEETIEINSESEEIAVKDASSSELEGEPNSKLLPKADDKTVDSFENYDDLSEKEKNAVLYKYLLTALDALGGGEEGVNDLLEEKGFESPNTFEWSITFSEIRENEPDKNFNETLSSFVESIIRQ